MKISVLISSRNRTYVLKRCLESVLSQDYSDYEIIVLDDASEDKNAYVRLIDMFDEQKVHLIRSERPLGVSGSRNLLMQQASGLLFVVIDDDAYFENNASLSMIAEIFEKNPDIGIMACRVQNHGVAERSYNVPFNWRSLRGEPSLLEKGRYVGYFLGTAHAIRREVIDTCGDYNPYLFFGEEELDLSYRVVSAGWKIWYEPSILVHHAPQPSVVGSGHGGEELYHHVKNRLYLAWRYLPWKYAIPYIGIWLGKYFLEGIECGCWRSYIRGIITGFQLLREVPREPLDSESVQYLKENFGRLWY